MPAPDDVPIMTVRLIARFQLAFLLCLYLYMGVVKITVEVAQNYGDLVMHFLGYLILMCSGLFTFPHRMHIAKLFVIFFSYSILIEFIQFFLPHRSFSLLDILANGTGLLVGISVGMLLLPVFQSLHAYGKR